MSTIHPLPHPSTTLLSSTALLPTPWHIINELLTNALDARATSLLLIISPPSSSSSSSSSSPSSSLSSTTISLRDNGHGIPPSSRQYLCKWHHTPKVTSLDDITQLGGRMLGFRGCALASMREVVGGLRVVTRTEGEDVGTWLDFGGEEGGKGEGAVRERGIREGKCAAPVGTTVEVRGVGMGRGVPVVRRREWERWWEGKGWVREVRRLCMAYVVARGGLRVEVRVKGGKDNWVCATGIGVGVEEGVGRVLGRGCVGECGWRVGEYKGFGYKALLPRVDAKVDRVNGVGQFVSVDGRPMDGKRGTVKKMVGLWREAMKKVGLEVGRECVMVLHLTCPPGSYDVNVEPAKDDVVFEDEGVVVEGWGRLLEEAYQIQRDDPVEEVEVTEPSYARIKDNQYSQSAQTDMDSARRLQSERRRSIATNMRDNIDDEDDFLPDVPSSGPNKNGDDDELLSEEATTKNPWVVAKMNAPLRTPAVSPSCSRQPVFSDNDSVLLEIDRTSPAKRIQQLDFENVPYLPTPQASSSPVRASPGLQSMEKIRTFPFKPAPSPTERVSSMLSSQQGRSTPVELTPAQLSQGTPLNKIPYISSQSQRPHQRKQPDQRGVHKPFKPPASTADDRDNWFSNAPSSSQPRPRKAQKPMRKQVQDAAHQLVLQGDESTPLAKPVKNRKIEEFMRPRKAISSSQSDAQSVDENTDPGIHLATGKRPAFHMQRQAARRRSGLQEIGNEAAPSSERIAAAAQPRSRRRTTGGSERAADGLHRTRSSHLPLERVPDDAQTQNISAHVNLQVTSLISEIRLLESKDAFNFPGQFSGTLEARECMQGLSALRLTDETVNEWIERIMEALQRRQLVVEGDGMESVLRKALSEYSSRMILE
ncbi:MAG: hypothetical protein M1820_007277 [Bogoriella megaspora]|nr:MAG: hypothetical protein M1820_007277 [Bogoriella megaspora]